jgi:hypothetical protein
VTKPTLSKSLLVLALLLTASGRAFAQQTTTIPTTYPSPSDPGGGGIDPTGNVVAIHLS